MARVKEGRPRNRTRCCEQKGLQLQAVASSVIYQPTPCHRPRTVVQLLFKLLRARDISLRIMSPRDE